LEQIENPPSSIQAGAASAGSEVSEKAMSIPANFGRCRNKINGVKHDFLAAPFIY
jgi:hypothetical protein